LTSLLATHTATYQSQNNNATSATELYIIICQIPNHIFS